MPPRAPSLVSRLLPAPGAPRVLAVTTFVNTFGNGLFATASTLFFVRSIGLPPAKVGLGLTLAAGLALLIYLPAGHLADSLGARRVLIAITLIQGFAQLLYIGVHGFWTFLPVAALVAASSNASMPVRQAIIAVVGQPNPAEVRAYLRAVANAGVALGTVAAGVALQIDTRAAYLSLLVGDAATFFVTAAVLTRLPPVPRRPRLPRPRGADGVRPPRPRMIALRDRPYLAVTGLNAVLAMHYAVLGYGMPLWVVERTSAPRWVAAALFLVNTVMCVLFQVRLSRGSDDVSLAGTLLRRSGLVLALSCLVFAATGLHLPVGIVIGLLFAAAFVEVLGELWQVAGSWGVGFGLAPSDLQGQYQGLFSLGFGTVQFLGPVLGTVLLVEWGWPGWLVFAAVFVAAGLVAPHVVGWAQANRPWDAASPAPVAPTAVTPAAHAPAAAGPAPDHVAPADTGVGAEVLP